MCYINRARVIYILDETKAAIKKCFSRRTVLNIALITCICSVLTETSVFVQSKTLKKCL